MVESLQFCWKMLPGDCTLCVCWEIFFRNEIISEYCHNSLTFRVRISSNWPHERGLSKVPAHTEAFPQVALWLVMPRSLPHTIWHLDSFAYSPLAVASEVSFQKISVIRYCYSYSLTFELNFYFMILHITYKWMGYKLHAWWFIAFFDIFLNVYLMFSTYNSCNLWLSIWSKYSYAIKHSINQPN